MKGCRPLSDEEIALIVSGFTGKFANRDRAWVILGSKSGYRISEILSLTLGQVIQFGRIVDRVTVKRCSMKGKIEGRTLLLHPHAKVAILGWVQDLQLSGADLSPDSFLFRSRKGRNNAISRHQAWHILSMQFEKCGMSGNLGTHSLRKHFAGRMYELLNHDLIKTQRAMNHKSVASTCAYLSFKEEEIDEAILSL